MAGNDDYQDRTEEATAKRRQEAREKGQVPRSRELNTMAVLLAASGGILFWGPRMGGNLEQFLRSSLILNRHTMMDPRMMTVVLGEALHHGFWLILPLLIIMAVAVLFTSVALGGFTFSPEALTFHWERIDPIAGLGRLFSWQGLMEVVKALFKFLIVAAIVVAVLWVDASAFIHLGMESITDAMMRSGHLLGWGFLLMSSGLIILALIDVPFQLWQYSKQLRMSRQEIKDEYKETEGRPEIKSQQRRLQQDVARRRMMEEVPKADVVVTNPTHYAVALRYDGENDSAPRLVAKGKGEIAFRIREIAEKNGVLVYSAPPLARSLYVHSQLGAEIPAALFYAVAQLLAYVYQIQSGNMDFELNMDFPIPSELAVPVVEDE